MTHSQVFGSAKWISAPDDGIYPIIRKNFNTTPDEIACLRILGFGGFMFYVNGKRGTDEYFLPLDSDFEDRSFPKDEQTAHRAYFCEYDITHLLRDGENTLTVMLGEGWYSGSRPAFGCKKLCFDLTLTSKDGVRHVVSDTSLKYAPSYLSKGELTFGEEHDYSEWCSECLGSEFDDGGWDNVIESRPPDTDYQLSTCPADRILCRISPMRISETVYDAGKNISGFPVLRGKGDVRVTFSEEILLNGELDPSHMHKQYLIFKNASGNEELSAAFTWLGFRYFKVEGDATVEYVAKVHSDVPVNSNFECSNSVLNWIYDTYVNTQLCNMHSGIPSDCPHLERRGYTGDGQLTCRAAMTTLDCKSFYEKWIDDISDCQDRISGHVQYTAPYTHSGGGPGGWGSAIVIVPYEYWKFYGDDSKIRAMYPQMLRYFEYMESHSENGLVVRDTEGEWCLGEWCTPGPVILPAPFVNNYFYIKAMQKAIEIAKYLGNDRDVPQLEKRIEERKKAIMAAYFNPWDGNFIGNVQGANAIALDIGLGDKRTRASFISYYDRLGHYDTGIFGTDIVTRLLFEYDRPDIAVRLMSADTPWGFGKWQKDGASTFWEYWYESRSHSHPMFGAVTTYLFEYILGITRTESGIEIRPRKITALPHAKGHITVSGAPVHICVTTENGKMTVSASLPEGLRATLILPDGSSYDVNGSTMLMFLKTSDTQ